MIDLNISVQNGSRLIIEAESHAGAKKIVDSSDDFEFHAIFKNENTSRMNKVRIDGVLKFHALKSGGLQITLMDGTEHHVGGYGKEGPLEVIAMH